MKDFRLPNVKSHTFTMAHNSLLNVQTYKPSTELIKTKLASLSSLTEKVIDGGGKKYHFDSDSASLFVWGFFNHFNQGEGKLLLRQVIH